MGETAGYSNLALKNCLLKGGVGIMRQIAEYLGKILVLACHRFRFDIRKRLEIRQPVRPRPHSFGPTTGAVSLTSGAKIARAPCSLKAPSTQLLELALESSSTSTPTTTASSEATTPSWPAATPWTSSSASITTSNLLPRLVLRFRRIINQKSV